MTALTPPISHYIASCIDQLEQLQPPEQTATEAQALLYRAQVDRLSVLVGSLRSLALQLGAEAKAAAQPEQRLPHPAEVLAHLAARMPGELTAEQLVARYRAYAAAVDLVLAELEQPEPEPEPEPEPAPAPTPEPAPAPTPAPEPTPPAPPPAPAPQPAPPGALPDPLPPLETEPPPALTYSLAWYLEQLTPEMQRHRWPDISLQGAQRHWQQHGRRQGRKWRPDAPLPWWGPQEEHAPPGTRL